MTQWWNQMIEQGWTMVSPGGDVFPEDCNMVPATALASLASALAVVEKERDAAAGLAERVMQDRERLEKERDQLREALTDLYAYTNAVEKSFGAQVAVRSYLSFPDGAKALGERVRALVGEPEEWPRALAVRSSEPAGEQADNR